MKIPALCLLLLFYFTCFSQPDKPTPIKVNFYIPIHFKNLVTGNEKLTVYLMPLQEEYVAPYKVVGKKLKDNEYEFLLPQKKFWYIAFQLGTLKAMQFCVNNEDGSAPANYDFTTLLEKGIFDYKKIRFIPPCPADETEDEPPTIKQ
jgi:hypothetical protein